MKCWGLSCVCVWILAWLTILFFSCINHKEHNTIGMLFTLFFFHSSSLIFFLFLFHFKHFPSSHLSFFLLSFFYSFLFTYQYQTFFFLLFCLLFHIFLFLLSFTLKDHFQMIHLILSVPPFSTLPSTYFNLNASLLCHITGDTLLLPHQAPFIPHTITSKPPFLSTQMGHFSSLTRLFTFVISFPCQPFRLAYNRDTLLFPFSLSSLTFAQQNLFFFPHNWKTLFFPFKPFHTLYLSLINPSGLKSSFLFTQLGHTFLLNLFIPTLNFSPFSTLTAPNLPFFPHNWDKPFFPFTPSSLRPGLRRIAEGQVYNSISYLYTCYNGHETTHVWQVWAQKTNGMAIVYIQSLGSYPDNGNHCGVIK